MSRTAITVEIGNGTDDYLDESTRAVCPASLILHTGTVELPLALTLRRRLDRLPTGRPGAVDWADSLTETSPP